MRARLEQYQHGVPIATITPWALVEPFHVLPPDRQTRNAIFGETKLALLYSGTLGRAHSFDAFLELARSLATESIQFCFAGRGCNSDSFTSNRDSTDCNIRYADFAPESDLLLRLTSCDIHMVSLREEWTGTVVPSKFFGALAVGRPVLFAGSPDCSIAHWIREYHVGWVLSSDTIVSISAELIMLSQDPEKLQSLQRHCLDVYTQHFSRQMMLNNWHHLIASLVSSRNRCN